MNIIVVTQDYPPYSMSQVALNVKKLVRALSGRGHNVYVVCVNSVETRVGIDNIEVIAVAPSIKSHINYLSYAWSLTTDLTRGISEAVHRLRGLPALVCAYEWVSGLAALPLKTALGVKLFFFIHSTEHERGGVGTLLGDTIAFLERLIVEKADYVVAYSKDSLEILTQTYRAPREKTLLVHDMDDLITRIERRDS